MAARDSRRRNNRATVNTTTQRQRTVDGGQTSYTLPGVHNSHNYMKQNFRNTSANAHSGRFYKEGLYYSSDSQVGDQQPYAMETSPGSGDWKRHDGKNIDISFQGVDPYRYGESHNFIRHNAKISIDNPNRTVTDTVSSSRMQALDKRSGDDDAQARRNLKTKRDGRNKLRISMAGDKSSGRLKGGPNSGRQQNKLKIDVQSSGGKPGINVPR